MGRVQNGWAWTSNDVRRANRRASEDHVGKQVRRSNEYAQVEAEKLEKAAKKKEAVRLREEYLKSDEYGDLGDPAKIARYEQLTKK